MRFMLFEGVPEIVPIMQAVEGHDADDYS